MTVTITTKIPKDEIAHLERRLVDDPATMIYVVGVIQTERILLTPNDPDRPRAVAAALLHIEAIGDEDAATAEDTLRRIYEKRTGYRALPFERDDDEQEED